MQHDSTGGLGTIPGNTVSESVLNRELHLVAMVELQKAKIDVQLRVGRPSFQDYFGVMPLNLFVGKMNAVLTGRRRMRLALT